MQQDTVIGGQIAPPTFNEAVRVWLRIGLLSFGGPAGQIALMHKELVEKRKWIDEQRGLAARQPRRYATLDEAVARMQAENKHLTAAQAAHLTRFGVNQNEDGTLSWKFDNYLRSWPASDMTQPEIESLWQRITCPTLLIYGGDSAASNPVTDGRVQHFKSARVVTIPGASHWVHHDRLDAFMTETEAFLAD